MSQYIGTLAKNPWDRQIVVGKHTFHVMEPVWNAIKNDYRKGDIVVITYEGKICKSISKLYQLELKEENNG